MIGIDLVYIPRIRRLLGKAEGDGFVEKILTTEEKSRFRSCDPTRRANILAEFYAAKEAVIKASIAGLTLADLDHIDVSSDVGGRHIATALESGDRFFVSMNRMGEYIFAVAVACE